MTPFFSPAQWLAVLCATAAFSAGAQPALSFQSVVDGYRPAADEKLTPWTTANETVYRRGGWKAYAQEASASESTKESTSGSPAMGAAKTNPHAGHEMQQPAKEKP